MGWNYALQWLVVLPLELSAAAIVVNYWKTDLNSGIYITIFFVLIIIINMFGVKGKVLHVSAFSFLSPF